MGNPLQTQPVAVAAAVNAVLALVLGLFVHPDPTATGIIEAAVNAVLALFVRQQVTANVNLVKPSVVPPAALR
jgi:hypothetical protein